MLVVVAKTPGFLWDGKGGAVALGGHEGSEDSVDAIQWFIGDRHATLQSFAIAVFAFAAHTNAVPVAVALKQPRAVRIWKVSLLSVIIEFVVYMLIGTCGY